MDYENLTPQYRIEEYLEAIVEGWVDATMVAYPDYPSWRIEEFLDAFITYIWEDGDHPRKPCPEPAWRLEECLRAIYDVMTGAATPWPFPLPTTNRIEEYLAAIHAYLADNTELPVPEPVWRIEQWLAYALDAVKHGGGVTKTVSGTMVHITDALAKAALSVLVSIEPIQDLHGYANPWPAGGGKNKLPPNYSGGASLVTNHVTYTNTDGVVNVTGTPTGDAYYGLFRNIDGQRLPLPSGTYTISCQETTANCKVNFNVVGGVSSTLNANQHSYTFTLSSDGEMYANILTNGNSYVNLTLHIQIESGSTATSWEPYENICPISGRTGISVFVGPTTAQADATTYAVDWTSEAGTVYGGTLDVVTGVLTVTHVSLTPIIRELQSINSYGIANFAFSFSTGYEAKDTQQAKGSAISNLLTVQTSSISSTQEQGFLIANITNGYVRLDSSVASTKEQANTWIADNGFMFVYELATPLTYQLTAQEVQMLLGENNVWSSSGDTVSVTYYAEGNANTLQSLNILLGGNYSNPKTADDVSDKEALEIILGGNK